MTRPSAAACLTCPSVVPRCGMRGGYMEVVGLEPKVLAHLEKYFAVMLCPNVSGQVCEEVTHMHRCTQTDRHTDTHTQSDTQIHTHGETHR